MPETVTVQKKSDNNNVIAALKLEVSNPESRTISNSSGISLEMCALDNSSGTGNRSSLVNDKSATLSIANKLTNSNSNELCSSLEVLTRHNTDLKKIAEFNPGDFNDNNGVSLILNNPNTSDSESSRASKVVFRGQDSNNVEGDLAEIMVAHNGTGTDKKGKMLFNINDGDDPVSTLQTIMELETEFNT